MEMGVCSLFSGFLFVGCFLYLGFRARTPVRKLPNIEHPPRSGHNSSASAACVGLVGFVGKLLICARNSVADCIQLFGPTVVGLFKGDFPCVSVKVCDIHANF